MSQSTPGDLRKREQALARRWGRLIKDAASLARDKGCKEPYLYVEAESGFVVFDVAETGWDFDRIDCDKQAAIHVNLGWGDPEAEIHCDVGAW